MWTVSQLNRHVRELLEADYRLQDMWVTGEMSNLSRPSSGHMYFTLKEAKASVRCVMWRPEVSYLGWVPREGQAVEAHGHVSLYEAGGSYQFYVNILRPAGEGELYQAFLQLKDRLGAEGLFDPERKRPLPDWPRRIGVVTSPTAAALHDVLNVLRRRYPLADVILAPTPVQGDEAPQGIVASLEALNRDPAVDVILLVRGGGSLEDLWAFNQEAVARAIAASTVPVVAGVGHEVDFTIADFVADVRAPTPSAAAELATPDVVRIAEQLQHAYSNLHQTFSRGLGGMRWSLEAQVRAMLRASPHYQISTGRQRVDEMAGRLARGMEHGIAVRREALSGLTMTLGAVAPLSVLDRGYAIVTRAADGELVRRIAQVSPGEALEVRVSDGTFTAETTAPGEEG